MKTLTMPSFGADMETGKVVEWCVHKGDAVKKGATVALIETAKGLIDMEVFEDCIVEDFLVPLDEEIDVGRPILGLQGNAETEAIALNNIETTPVESEQKVQQTESMVAVKRIEGIASPAVRLFAQKNQIALDGITGTGVDGAICLADLQREKPEQKVPAKAGFDADMMRKAIAAVVTKSKRDIPHYYLQLDVDLTEAENWLIETNAAREVENRIMINVPIMAAVAKALHKNPDFNGFYQNDRFQHAPDVHLGLAIRLRNKGLMAPAIHNADKLSFSELMAKFKDVVERAKLGGLKQSEMQDATATLSNIGDRGSDVIFGVIFPPQVAIIGVGKVNQKACVVQGEIVPRTVVNISLAADHRVTDGQMGARFLNDIQKLLNKPAKLAGGE